MGPGASTGVLAEEDVPVGLCWGSVELGHSLQGDDLLHCSACTEPKEAGSGP